MKFGKLQQSLFNIFPLWESVSVDYKALKKFTNGVFQRASTCSHPINAEHCPETNLHEVKFSCRNCCEFMIQAFEEMQLMIQAGLERCSEAIEHCSYGSSLNLESDLLFYNANDDVTLVHDKNGLNQGILKPEIPETSCLTRITDVSQAAFCVLRFTFMNELALLKFAKKWDKLLGLLWQEKASLDISANQWLRKSGIMQKFIEKCHRQQLHDTWRRHGSVIMDCLLVLGHENSTEASQGICALCLRPIVDAQSTMCGHAFCSACAIRASHKSHRCPICRRRGVMSPGSVVRDQSIDCLAKNNAGDDAYSQAVMEHHSDLLDVDLEQRLQKWQQRHETEKSRCRVQ